MIRMLVAHCLVDMLPIEESPFYQDVMKRHGKWVADAFVYDVPVPPLEEYDDGPDIGVASENMGEGDQLGVAYHGIPAVPQAPP